MKRVFASLALAVGLVLATAGTALAADPAKPQSSGFYVGIFGGVIFDNDVGIDYADGTFETTRDLAPEARYGAFAGYRFNDYLRVEGELIRTRIDDSFSVDDVGDVDSTTKAWQIMANGYFDFAMLELPMGVVPYVGAGLGFTLADVGVEVSTTDEEDVTTVIASESGSDSAFTQQLMVGARMPVTEYVLVGAGYRLQHVGSLSDGDVTVDDSWNHAFELGVTLTF